MRAFRFLAKIPLAAIPLAAQTLSLADLERMALERNPVMGQSRATVAEAAGRARQAGLYPNPFVAAVGDEVAAGEIIRGGEFGVGFEQRIVTAGKLRLDRRVAEQVRKEAEAGVDATRNRLLATVRSLFYQMLGDRRQIEVRTELAALARRAVETSRELANVGQADRPDLLAAEIEAERMEVDLQTARNSADRTWRQLAAAVGDPGLKPAPLEGDLDHPPVIDLDTALETIYSQSPELRAALVNVPRAELAERRARVEKIPDVIIAGGVRYNRELLEPNMQPVGKEGFFSIGVKIPIFDRNQGGVAAARADVERSRLEVERVRLDLRARLAAVYRDYQDAMIISERYRTQMIPKAQQAFDMYLTNFRRMAAAYPQALIAQRNLFQLQDDYVKALVRAWQSAVEIQALLPGGIQ